MEIYSKNQYNHINSATTTTVFSGQGVLLGISVNNVTASYITIKDGTSNVAILAPSAPQGYYPFNVGIAGGLSVVTGGASDLTVIYRI